MTRTRLILLALLAAIAPLLVGYWLTRQIIVAINVRLPFEFTADIYDAEPSEVCPGDVITWQRTVIVNAPVNTITTLLWIDPETQRIVPIRDSTRQFIFIGNHNLSEYYRVHMGREVAPNEYPLVVSDTLTATVPALVSDGPLLLQETTVLEAREGDEYTVPIWILSIEECR